MHINLLKSRKEYFANLSVSEILHHFVNKSQVSVNDVRQLYSEGKVVVGTKEGNLEKLLGLESESDSLALVSKINELSEDQLLVLPPNYRIDSNDARQVVSYSLDTIVNLDSAIVKRKLMGDIIPRGRLSARRKQKEQWSPEKVVGAAFNHLYENREELAEKVFSCYGWWGKDGHRRVVSLYRAIQGAELRAFQNFAAFKLKTRQFRKELRLG